MDDDSSHQTKPNFSLLVEFDSENVSDTTHIIVSSSNNKINKKETLDSKREKKFKCVKVGNITIAQLLLKYK